MHTQTKKTLNLTKEEQKVIKELYNILDSDYQLSLDDTWDLLTDIACMDWNDEKFISTNYGYDIRIIN